MSIENDLRELARTYSTQLKNQINTIHEGDCLEVLDPIEKGSIDLAYLDPPFFTEKKHDLKTRDRTQEFRFDDIWGTDTAYSRFLLECISKVGNVLKKTAAIFVHCDNSANHIVMSVLDRVFGKNNLRQRRKSSQKEQFSFKPIPTICLMNSRCMKE